MGRIGILAVVVALSSILLGPIPAHAGSVWDPNDAGHRLDIRWVGVYHQTDDRLRITVAFHDRIRSRWFPKCGRFWFSLCPGGTFLVEFDGGAYSALFFRRYRHPGLRAQLCEGGSSCGAVAKVHRPDKETMRVRLIPSYGPGLGSPFRGVSFAYPMGHRTRVDRTRWGIVT